MNKIIWELFLSGLIFGSGPCLASCGPILISYVAATGKSALGGFKVYSLFSLARISVYLILSLAIYFLGRFATEKILGNLSPFIFVLGGIFLISIGISILLGKKIESGFLRALEMRLIESDKKSVLIMGLIIGFLPCVPFLAILSYIGLISKSWTGSLLYSLTFGIGTFISPLLLLTAAAGFMPEFFKDKKESYYKIIGFISGIIIIYLGFNLFLRAF